MELNEIEKERQILYDAIIGELNRVSITDDINELCELRKYLFLNIDNLIYLMKQKYYKKEK